MIEKSLSDTQLTQPNMCMSWRYSVIILTDSRTLFIYIWSVISPWWIPVSGRRIYRELLNIQLHYSPIQWCWSVIVYYHCLQAESKWSSNSVLGSTENSQAGQPEAGSSLEAFIKPDIFIIRKWPPAPSLCVLNNISNQPIKLRYIQADVFRGGSPGWYVWFVLEYTFPRWYPMHFPQNHAQPE